MKNLFFNLFFAVALLLPTMVSATSYTWNVASGDWSDANNWNPVGVPGAGDDATVNNSGTATLTANTTIQNLVFNDGTITGNYNLTINGTLNWGTSGTMAGSGTTSVLGMATISGGGYNDLRRLSARTLSIGGGGNFGMVGLGSYLHLLNDAVLRNEAGSMLTMVESFFIKPLSTGATGSVVNHGNLAVAAGATVIYQLGFTNTGSINIAANAEMQCPDVSPFLNLGGSVVINSNGQLRQNSSGTCHFTGASIVNNGTIGFATFAFTGTGIQSLSGNGNIGVLKIPANSTVNLSGTQTAQYIYDPISGTLGGSGNLISLNGLIANQSGTFSPGLSGIGTLGLNEIPQYPVNPENVQIQIEAGSPVVHDVLNITGNLTLSGSTLNISGPSCLPAGNYPIITWTEARNGDFTTVNAPDGYSIVYDDAQKQVNLTFLDIVPPAITCPANKTLTALPAPTCGKVATFSPATATDNCTGAITISYSQNSNTFFPIGLHTVTASATDLLGNIGTCSFTILIKPKAEITTNNIDDDCDGFIDEPIKLVSAVTAATTCTPSANGAVNLTVSQGVSPYSFSWSNGAVTEDLSATPPGIYIVTITDNQGLTLTKSFTIAPAMNLTVTKTDPKCFGATDGKATATATGGIGTGKTYLWGGGQTTNIITGLAAGTYSVVATDGGGCTISASTTLGEPAVLVLNYVINSATQVTLTAVGGTPAYKYRRCTAAGTLCKNSTGGAGYGLGNVFTGLTPGTTYKFQTQDKNKCFAEITVTMPTNKPSAGTENPNEKVFFENGSNRYFIENQTIGLSPNPFSDVLKLSRDSDFPENLSVKIYDLNGRLAAEKTWSTDFVSPQARLEIPTERLAAGVYFIKIFGENGTPHETLRAVKTE